MAPSRRDFIAAGLSGSLAARATSAPSEGAIGSADGNATNRAGCLDYGLSFVAGTAPFNSVRFWVESRTTIFDDKAGTRTEFYQCASCKSENTFGEKDLLYKDNYDFLPILGEG